MKNKRQKNNTLFLGILLWLIVFALTGTVILYLFMLFGGKSAAFVLGLKNYWLSAGVIDGLIIAGFLMTYRIDGTAVALEGNDLEDTEWLPVKKMRKMKEFTVTDFDRIENRNDGIVIGAEKKKKGVEITETSQLHALIVGTTGTGKTTGFVDQNIAVLSRSKTKPGLVITDPKRELFEKHAGTLQSKGYKISVLDLREPYSSARWNPMHVLVRRIRMVKNLEHCLLHKDGKYYANGEELLSFRAAATRKQELLDEIFESAMDLVYTLCPVRNKEQPTWEEGARNLILGFVLAMCEDCIKGRIGEDRMLLFNLYHNITKYCREDTTVLKNYLLEKRDEFSKVKGLVNTVLITSDKTLTSYLSEVNAYMQQLADDGIMSLTSGNDIDVINMDESPEAVFVIIPDERFTRHRFVTLFIAQVYKELIEKANLNARKRETPAAFLKRNTYFILDEFANLPKFDNIEGMVTIARSRGIRFLFVLQSFSQLNAKYGKDVGDIIKVNCNVKIFIGSDDYDTRREFSELCGNKKIKQMSVSTHSDSPASSNTGAATRPLITMGMLERLNGDKKGDAIVSVRGYDPIKTRFTPSYELKRMYFPVPDLKAGPIEPKVFDKQRYVFDIAGENDADGILKFIESMDGCEEYDTGMTPKKDGNKKREWDIAAGKVNETVENAVKFLSPEHAARVMAADFENKPAMLYLYMKEYNQSIARKLGAAADRISGEYLPEMRRCQSL